MASKLYLFNPEHDMALANFTPYYQPPQEIVRMGEDLSYLPLPPVFLHIVFASQDLFGYGVIDFEYGDYYGYQ